MSYYPNVYAAQNGPLLLSGLDANFDFAVDIQSQSLYAAAGGSADVITATYTPSVTALVSGLTLYLTAAYTNTTVTPTFAPNALTARTIRKANNQQLAIGDIAGAGHILILQYDATNTVWVLANPANAVGYYPSGTTYGVSYLNSTNYLITSSNFTFDGVQMSIGSTVPPGSYSGNIGKIFLGSNTTVTRGSFRGANIVIDETLAYAPPSTGGIAWGYTNAGTNSNAWVAILVDGTTSTGNGYGDLSIYTRSVTTDTAPTKRLTVDSTGNVLMNSAAVLGYGSGSGSQVTQGTSRTTTVTINTASGRITMFTAAGSATLATFTVNNSLVGPNDVIVLNQQSATNNYIFLVSFITSGLFSIAFYTTGGTAIDAPVINFSIIKGSNT